MSIFKKSNAKQKQSIKRELIFTNIAVIVVGILIVVFPESSTNAICRAVGVVLTIWGFFRIGAYFASRVSYAFGSFGLVQGAAILGFGVYFLVSPETLASFLTVILSIILIVGGAMKLQYGIDLARIKAKAWWAPLIAAGVMITLGIIAIINPFAVATSLMMFIGISLIVNGVLDLAAIVFLSLMLKRIEKSERQTTGQTDFVDVDSPVSYAQPTEQVEGEVVSNDSTVV